MNLPNKLTVFRIILVPILLILLMLWAISNDVRNFLL